MRLARPPRWRGGRVESSAASRAARRRHDHRRRGAYRDRRRCNDHRWRSAHHNRRRRPDRDRRARRHPCCWPDHYGHRPHDNRSRPRIYKGRHDASAWRGRDHRPPRPKHHAHPYPSGSRLFREGQKRHRDSRAVGSSCAHRRLPLTLLGVPLMWTLPPQVYSPQILQLRRMVSPSVALSLLSCRPPDLAER